MPFVANKDIAYVGYASPEPQLMDRCRTGLCLLQLVQLQ